MTNYEFECWNTAKQRCRTSHPRDVFPWVAQKLHPIERLDVLVGQYLHSIQVPHREKVNKKMGLFEGYQITFYFDMDFKTMNKVDLKSVCLTKPRKMKNSIRNVLKHPLGHRIQFSTKNWVDFIKMHLTSPYVEGMALLRGTRAFALELEEGEMVIGNVEKSNVTNLSLKLETFVYTSKENH